MDRIALLSAQHDIEIALNTLRQNKPTERSEASRHWAVCVTEMEKVHAYFKTYIADPAREESKDK